jgi:hypothetical protein
MFRYCNTRNYTPYQRKTVPDFFLEHFLIHNKRDLIDWFIHLEKFPKTGDNAADFWGIWRSAACSGNREILEWFMIKYKNINHFSSAVVVAVEKNQIDILNYILDNQKESKFFG